MKKVIAIIQARTASTRLPGKVLKKIAGKPMLFHVIEGARRCKKVNLVVTATTKREKDKAIIELAQKFGVGVFSGSENDVLDRYYQAAKKFAADVIVRITADCPLIDPLTIDEMIDLCSKKNAEYICGHPSFPSIEQGFEVISFSALERVKNMATKDYQKEHVTIFIHEHPELFKIKVIKPKPIFQRTDIRLTVDTKDDLKFMREIYDKLYQEGKIINIEDVVKLIDENPKLKEINACVEISDINKYSQSPNLKKKLLDSLRLRIVFRCDASRERGLGHLIRCLAVANELRKHYIVFATTKDETNSYIRAENFEIFLKKSNDTEEVFLYNVVSIFRPDVIVIDKKYPYCSTFLKHLKHNKTEIVMLDNICEGLSACDEVVFPNANLEKDLLKKFIPLTKIKQVKTGFKYVILRNEILALKNKITYNIHTPPNIIVTTGGADPQGVLIKLIPLLKEMNLQAKILILVGQAFRFRNELKHLAENLPQNFEIQQYLPQELIKGDITVCTFGVSIYEMIYLQVPTICISHSIENANGAKILEKRYGVIENLGYFKNINRQDLNAAITKLIKDKNYYLNMVKRCDGLIDGDGAKRIGEIITDTYN